MFERQLRWASLRPGHWSWQHAVFACLALIPVAAIRFSGAGSQSVGDEYLCFADAAGLPILLLLLLRGRFVRSPVPFLTLAARIRMVREPAARHCAHQVPVMCSGLTAFAALQRVYQELDGQLK